MRFLIYIFIFFVVCLNAQDKLYFKNATLKKCYLITITKDKVYYKNFDTSATSLQANKSDLVMLETYNGIRYLFFEEEKLKIKTDSIKPKQNNLGLQPFNFLIGRFTFNYERLTNDAKIGFMIPFSITYNPFESIYKSQMNSTNFNYNAKRGTNIITGLDINFYIGNKQNSQFFMGPRFRYGTDLFITNIEAYSLQTQFGYKYQNPKHNFVQHLSLGFGFARILSLSGNNRINSKQSYVWYSLNYRLSIKW